MKSLDEIEACPHYRAEISYRNKAEAPFTKNGVRYTFWRCPDCGA